jgi:glycosyltransferase involved in cell wall biosynthesis
MVSAAEAHRIGKSLASVAEWTGEIIVVLNEEVTDDTEKIAKSHGAKVIREPWKGMIGQKASVAAKATQEWILDLDADEVVSDELRDEIQQRLSETSLNGQVVAFSYPRLSWYCGKWIRHGDWYPDRQNRLWRRGRANWGGVDPHAKLIVDGEVKKLRGDLLHYSNDSINRQIQKIIPFSDEFLRQHPAGGAGTGVFDLGIRPIWRFFRAYIFRGGFLDGWPGYYIAWLNAFSTVTRYAKVRENALSPNVGAQEREQKIK